MTNFTAINLGSNIYPLSEFTKHVQSLDYTLGSNTSVIVITPNPTYYSVQFYQCSFSGSLRFTLNASVETPAYTQNISSISAILTLLETDNIDSQLLQLIDNSGTDNQPATLRLPKTRYFIPNLPEN